MKLKNKKIKFRKLRISDYDEFSSLFYSCYRKKISFDFYKWRYFSNNFSFCYGAFESSNLIANVGMVSMKLNTKIKSRVYSRHSSMVLKKYRGQGIFSELLKRVKNILRKVPLIVMWPNKKNFSNFGIKKEYVLIKKYYLCKLSSNNPSSKKNINHPIQKITELETFFEQGNYFFFKDYSYFKKRYLLYKPNEYFINEYKLKNLRSFFILKKNIDKTGFSFVIIDHFGSTKVISSHFNSLSKNLKYDNLIYLSKNKQNNFDYITFKIGILRKDVLTKLKSNFLTKEIFLGDTDIFISI
ncbi:GNAT family N-acetyltransferase [Candidatus Pelagibacter bacterium nBUS_49]|uniref:GNAT family N-acetyltransferase n=1 Tax=Candidatus Pelagibacter bacterium nBUS_49 TaxID=3374196 RepID=UPI003EBAA304